MTGDDDAIAPEPAERAATQLGRRVRADEPAASVETGQTRLGRRAQAPDASVGSAVDDPGGRSADTQLGRRARAAGEAPAPAGDTRIGRRGRADDAPATEDTATSAADAAGVIRFGPGVPRAPAASPEWSSARPGAATARRRRRPWIGGLVTVALVAGVLAYLLTRVDNPIQAHAEQVTAASQPGACDTVVDVVGTIATNGRPGTVTYQWIRNDGQPTSVLTQSVPDGATTTQVHLQWTFSGHGRFDARATLRVLDPAPTSETTGAFTYSCS